AARRANLLTDVQHGRFVALAFANDDVPGDLDLFKSAAHGLHRGLVRPAAVALSHSARGSDGGFFHHPHEIADQIAFQRASRGNIVEYSHVLRTSWFAQP